MNQIHRLTGRPRILPVRTSNRPTVGQLARAQTFRFLTMVATWALIFAAFVYEPGWIRDSLRFMTHSIESFADQVPEPWGARLEIMLRDGRDDLDSDRLGHRLAAADHLGAIPYLATVQRTPASLSDGLTRPFSH
jgi:hypothetical protein